MSKSTDEAASQSSSLLPEHVLDQVFIHCLKNEYSLVSAEEAKSAQQRVVILQVARRARSEDGASTAIDESWSECLTNGRNRLVVRIWKGGSNWWNLNRNQDPWILARQEIQGYQLAHKAFSKENQETNKASIPRVLYHELSRAKESSSSCWAVLEYVGLHSVLFENGNDRTPDSWYMEKMIKVRHEFGFDEPHPRWGRVPTEDCLEYAAMILKEFVLPLQRNTKQGANGTDNHKDSMSPQNFGTMVQIYQRSFQEILSSCQSDVRVPPDERMINSLETVKEALARILPEQLSRIPPMSPVLVHLDLQPQNLLFYTTREDGSIHVSSVLDWEDASLADPRFEVLLMCRKVCANRSQANALWSLYKDSIKEDPGPIEPWLQLECIHSILTLLLQSMDLLNGGRNPWETKKELWGKLEREFYRWNELNKSNEIDI